MHLKTLPRPDAYVDVHSYGQMIMYPYGNDWKKIFEASKSGIFDISRPHLLEVLSDLDIIFILNSFQIGLPSDWIIMDSIARDMALGIRFTTGAKVFDSFLGKW